YIAMVDVTDVVIQRSMYDPQNKVLLFTGIDKAKFRRPVVPGDTLRIQMTLLRFNGRLCRLHGEAYVDGKLVAEAEVTSVLVDRRTIESTPPDFRAGKSS